MLEYFTLGYYILIISVGCQFHIQVIMIAHPMPLLNKQFNKKKNAINLSFNIY